MFIYSKKDACVSGISHCSDATPMDSDFYKHFHENCELHYFVDGDANYNIDGEFYSLNRFHLLFVPETTYHFLIPLSNREYESYVIYFKREFMDHEQVRQLLSKPHIINIAGDVHLRSMFSLFDYYYETYSSADFEEASDYLLHEILLYLRYKLEGGCESRAVSLGHPLITEVVSFISQNLQSELNCDVVAKQVNFSKAYVQSKFSRMMGIGLQKYINLKKIHAAHTDIQNGISPYEAAEKYGYHDYSSFFRQYKKFFGHSPKNTKD